jgi:cytochrome c
MVPHNASLFESFTDGASVQTVPDRSSGVAQGHEGLAHPSVCTGTAGCSAGRIVERRRCKARASGLLLVLVWLFGVQAAAWAQGTLDEAKALAERAAIHMREAGPKQAIADFNDLNGGYCDRNLFVVTYDQQRKVVSSLRVPAYLGRDATRFLDEDGKEFGKAIIATAETNGAGWVDYRMTNPATMKVERKSSYVIQVGDYILIVGAYKP